jgi:cation transport regulator
MPYARNADLPKPVRDSLPQGAQTIYRKAFNSAWQQYDEAGKRRGSATREETAHRVAWAAVKVVYRKQGDRWMKKN